MTLPRVSGEERQEAYLVPVLIRQEEVRLGGSEPRFESFSSGHRSPDSHTCVKMELLFPVELY